MAKPIPTAQLEAIERVVRAHPDGVSAAEIAAALPEKSANRTLQSQLSRLVREGRLVMRRASGSFAGAALLALAGCAPVAIKMCLA